MSTNNYRSYLGIGLCFSVIAIVTRYWFIVSNKVVFGTGYCLLWTEATTTLRNPNNVEYRKEELGGESGIKTIRCCITLNVCLRPRIISKILTIKIQNFANDPIQSFGAL